MGNQKLGAEFRAFMDTHEDMVYTDNLLQAEARLLADRAVQADDRMTAYEGLRVLDAGGILRPGFRADNPEYAAYVAEKEAAGDKLRSVRAMTNYMAQVSAPDNPVWEAEAARYADETLEAVDNMMEQVGGFEAVFLGLPDDVPETVDTDELRDILELKDEAYASILAAENAGAPMGDLRERYPDYGGWAFNMDELAELAAAEGPAFVEEGEASAFGELFGADVTRKPERELGAEAGIEKDRGKNGPSVGQEADTGHGDKNGGHPSIAEDTPPRNQGRSNRRRLGPEFDIGGVSGDERQFD